MLTLLLTHKLEEEADRIFRVVDHFEEMIAEDYVLQKKREMLYLIEHQ